MKDLGQFEGIDFGMIDSRGRTVREGDVVCWKSEDESVVCQVKWNPLRFAFNLIELNGKDPTFEQTLIRRQGQYVRIGNEEEFPGIVSKWRRLKDARYGFLRQAKPDICFPLAALNACVGAGIEKAFLNFKLLDEMAVAGECHWGGCVNPQAALNTIQKSLHVDFVKTDSVDDVLENGGILSLKTGNVFHACAVFMIDEDPYLVNSNIGEGEFVRPLIDVSEISQAEDPEDRADYVIVRS